MTEPCPTCRYWTRYEGCDKVCPTCNPGFTGNVADVVTALSLDDFRGVVDIAFRIPERDNLGRKLLPIRVESVGVPWTEEDE